MTYKFPLVWNSSHPQQGNNTSLKYFDLNWLHVFLVLTPVVCGCHWHNPDVDRLQKEWCNKCWAERWNFWTLSFQSFEVGFWFAYRDVYGRDLPFWFIWSWISFLICSAKVLISCFDLVENVETPEKHCGVERYTHTCTEGTLGFKSHLWVLTLLWVNWWILGRWTSRVPSIHRCVMHRSHHHSSLSK